MTFLFKQTVVAAAGSAVMEAVNHSKNSAMEAENHVKHGARSKSLMSRGNFLKAFFALLLASATLMIGCGGSSSGSGSGSSSGSDSSNGGGSVKSVVGTWETEYLTLIFNSDGTGKQIAAGLPEADVIYTVTETSSEAGKVFQVSWGTGDGSGNITHRFGTITWDGEDKLDDGRGIVLTRK